MEVGYLLSDRDIYQRQETSQDRGGKGKVCIPSECSAVIKDSVKVNVIHIFVSFVEAFRHFLTVQRNNI